MNNQTPMQIVPLGFKALDDSISTNIRTILMTSRGEVPFRPRFGLGAEQLLGGGMAAIDIAYEVADQLTRYEKRIKVHQVVSTEPEPGQRKIAIHYTVLQTNEQQTIIIQ